MTFVHVSRVASRVLDKVADGFTDRVSSENPASVPNRLPTMGERNIPKDRSKRLPHGSEIDDGTEPLTGNDPALLAHLPWIDAVTSTHFCVGEHGSLVCCGSRRAARRYGAGRIKKMAGIAFARGPPSGPPHRLGDTISICAAIKNIRRQPVSAAHTGQRRYKRPLLGR